MKYRQSFNRRYCVCAFVIPNRCGIRARTRMTTALRLFFFGYIFLWQLLVYRQLPVNKPRRRRSLSGGSLMRNGRQLTVQSVATLSLMLHSYQG